MLITVSLNCTSLNHTILIDTCVGNHKSNKFFEPWFNRTDEVWLTRLAACGAAPEDVDFVLCTHLHLDHCDWNTQLVDGRWQPTFPNAKDIFARKESDHRRSVADSTFVENIVPVVEAGQAVLVAMNDALDDEVCLVPTPGHPPGHASIRLTSKGSRR